MNEFLFELDKFYQTYKLETEFELGFHKQKQKVQILMFILKFLEFESNSKLKRIWFELIQRKNEKPHYSLGPRCGPRLEGLPGPSAACQAYEQAFGRPMPTGTPSAQTARDQHAWPRLERHHGELVAG
jgi:hypothetical protein